MSQFHDKFNNLKPYIIGVRFIDKTTIIDIVFKDGWVPPTSNRISVKKSNESNVNYYMVYSENEEILLDELLDYVEHAISVNIEREKKIELFQKKVKDMEELFKKSSLTELEKMKFKLDNDSFTPDLFNPQFNEDVTEENNEEFVEKELPIMEPQKVKDELKEKNEKLQAKIKTMDFDLPPKPNEKIVLEDFQEVKSVCKCGPNESCEACLDY